MSYQSQRERECNYCKSKLSRLERVQETGKWAAYNMDGSLHTYQQCKAIQNNKQQLPSLGKTQTKPYVGGSSTFSATEEPKSQGVTQYSLLIQISETKKEVKELRKQIETLASIIDSMAQKQDLMITKIGYPKPEPVQSEAMKKLIESKEQVKTPFDPKPKKDESGVAIKDGQEVKAVQTHPTQEELNQVINPMRTQKAIEEIAKFENKTPAQTEKDLVEDFYEASQVLEWENISEAFICVSCEGKIHNGWINRAGTKLCNDCKTEHEANIMEAERIKVNNEPNQSRPRSIEDINSDEGYNF